MHLFVNVCAHSMCQTEGCDVFTATCTGTLSETFIVFTSLFSISLSLFLSSVLSTDNMVDQTKVETSEAKAVELEKKVKYTRSHLKIMMYTRQHALYIDIFIQHELLQSYRQKRK